MRKRSIILHSGLALGLVAPVLAEEGGAGRYVPGNSATLVAEARWLPELDTRRRLEGDFFWLKVAYQF